MRCWVSPWGRLVIAQHILFRQLIYKSIITGKQTFGKYSVKPDEKIKFALYLAFFIQLWYIIAIPSDKQRNSPKRTKAVIPMS